MYSRRIIFWVICLEIKTLITAHRGASGLAPENTMAAILLAMKLGADYCEVDVQETADGKISALYEETVAVTDKGVIMVTDQ